MTPLATHFPQSDARHGPEQAAIDNRGLERRLQLALSVALTVFGGLGVWAAVAQLSGAVIAPGRIIVDGNVRKVQHPTGGIVGELRVKNGDRVSAGDVLVRLDDTQTKAALAIVVSQLMELTARKARLAAERDGATEIVFSEALIAGSEQTVNGELRLFDIRRISVAGQKAQLGERIGQYRKETVGLAAQIKAKEEEVTLVKQELARISEMQGRNLLPVTRLLAMTREAVRTEGEYGALVAQRARVEGQISEVELQVIGVDEGIRTDAQKELREIEAKISELLERQIAAEDQLRRIAIRAPVAGVIHARSIDTVGGVISAGETLMMIVPSEEALTVEVRLSPTDIDQVAIGQRASLRFAAFNHNSTPELTAEVVHVAAEVMEDPQTRQSHYIAHLRIASAELAKLRSSRLVPGMPVDCFIQTEQRTALSYLLKPLRDQFALALRQD